MAKMRFRKVHERFMNLSYAIKKSAEEIVDVVYDESKRVYLEKKKKGVVTSGVLLASFMKDPVKHRGTLQYEGIVYVDTGRAPYAIYVDQIGWKQKEGGHKEAYGFMEAGAKKGEELAAVIVAKNITKYV